MRFIDAAYDRRPPTGEGPGTEFGEIALLRDVPRTATVTAFTDVEVLGPPREVFLAAVAGDRDSRVAADLVVSVRLGEVPQREV